MRPDPTTAEHSTASHAPGIRRHLMNAFLVLFLTLQLILPLNGCFNPAQDTRGNFSWNMYSRVYRCRYKYEWVSRYGQRDPVDIKRYFNRPKLATKIMHRDTLPAFHAWLNTRLRVDDPQGSLQARIRSSENGGPYQNLVVSGTWLGQEESTP
jgi:hypothetical protein